MPLFPAISPRLRSKALRTTILIVLFLAFTGAGTPKPETSSQPESTELYKLGQAAADQKDFALALSYFQKARKADPKDPEVLNMLAYSLRKTGKIDEAIETYKEALKLRPEFPEAREYLGEAYVQAALREVETLRGYGGEASEELEELIEAIQEAARGLE